MKNSLFSAIQTYSERFSLMPRNAKLIIGLSGGPDSVFLMHYLASIAPDYNVSLIAVHLDHEWRPESGRDALFCKEIAQKLGIPLISKKLSELNLSIAFNGSKEEIGRKARRFLFEQIREETQAAAIALGHHAQDQQETFFIRLLRGSSLSGLTAMKPKEGLYIRPLLQINKADILEYLHSQNIQYLTDPSNTSDIYLRNRIRSKVIPGLVESDQRFDANFLATLNRLQETEDFLQELAQHTFAQIAVENNGIVWVAIDKLLSQHPVLRYRIIVLWLIAHKVKFPPSQSFFDEIIRFLGQANTQSHAMHHDWRILKKKGFVTIQINN